MATATVSELLEEIGRPGPDKAFSGLRSFDRVYRVKGAAVRAENIESKVFIAYGDNDAEFTNALLVSQRMEKRGSEPTAIETVLVRRFQEFTSGQKVPVGEDLIETNENGRQTITKRYVALASEAEDLAAEAGDTLDGGLVCVGAGVNKSGVGATIAEVYIQAGDEFDQVGPDLEDRELNGLRRVRRTLIAKQGTAWPALVVGTTPLSGDAGAPILAGVSSEGSTIAVVRLSLTYLEPGVISKREQAGPVPGSKEYVWQTWILDATSAADMGEGNTIPGELTGRSDENVQGYKMHVWSSVGGSITGTKQTYKDIVDVRVPGTVELTTQSISAGDLSGTVAVANVTPPRTKSVVATVTVEITTSPPDSASAAYDLGSISCSVRGTQAAYNYRGFDSGSTRDGSVNMSHPRRSASINASIQFYPGCYLSGSTSATGTFTYTAGAQYSLSSGGSILTETALTSTETNTLTGTGSTTATGYSTSGVLQRRSRPVFTTLAGTTYYEVTTWTV